MAKKTPIEKLDAAIAKTLEEYSTELMDGIRASTEAVAKAGAAAVRATSRSSFNGKAYAAGWTSKVENSRLSAEAVIYNKDHYQLAHLLENGHALRRGGRSIGKGFVDGREHIKPVEEEIAEKFEKKVKAII